MQELLSIEVELPRRRVLRVEPLNRRFVKMGFAKLESLKRDSLPIVDTLSPSRRHKTDRDDKSKYFNEFAEFNYHEDSASNSSLRVKKQIQPLCIYKKPRIKDNPFSFRRKVLPRMSDKKLTEETGENEFAEGTKAESGAAEAQPGNMSILLFGESELVTFYPNRKSIN